MKKCKLLLGTLSLTSAVFAQTVFFEADFEASTPTNDVTKENLDIGTATGSWTVTAVGSYPSSINRKDSENNTALLMDGRYDFTADFSDTAPLDLGVTISLNTYSRRSGTDLKDSIVQGLDTASNVVFEVRLNSGDTSVANYRRVGFYDSTGSLHYFAPTNTVNNFGNSNPQNGSFQTLTLKLGATTMDIEYDGIQTNAVAYRTGGVTELNRIRFYDPAGRGTASFFLDDLNVFQEPLTVFEADFETSAPTDPSGSNLTTTNLNDGTVAGSWIIDADGGGNGLYAAVITNAEDNAQALMLARDDYDATAVLTKPVPLAGTTVSLDAYLRLKAANAPENAVIGLDSTGREVFEILLISDSDTEDPGYRAVAYRDASDTIQYLGSNRLKLILNNVYDPSLMKNLSLTLGTSSMDIAWNGTILTNAIAYKDAAASDLATIRFVSKGAGTFMGIICDNIKVTTPKIGSAPSGFDAWISTYNLSGSPAADPDYDYDGDGWDNLMEYALGGNPTNGTFDGAQPYAELTGGTLRYMHALHTNDTSLIYSLEMTDDLVSNSWTNMGYTVTGTNMSGAFFEVTNAIPATNTVQFIRLNVQN